MANFLKRLIVVQVPAHRLRRERRNLMYFASAAAALSLLLLFQSLPETGPISPATASVDGDLAASSGEGASAAVAGKAAAPEVPDPRQQAIVRHLAKRYLVSPDAVETVMDTAHRAASQYRLDPLLILAVVAVESRFNPVAESGAGAKGLMQVIPKYHPEKVEAYGGEKALLDPQTNVLVGAAILREYLNRTGDLTSALQMYNGSRDDANLRYSRKVLSEHQRLNRLVAQSQA